MSKIIRTISALYTLVILGFVPNVIYGQISITDRSGISHILSEDASYNTYHDFPNSNNSADEIYLHHFRPKHGNGNVTYWHARVIHAGFNIGDNFSSTPTAIFGGANSNNTFSDDTYHTSYSTTIPTWAASHPTTGNDLTWYDGFFVCDGYYSDEGHGGRGPTFLQNGDIDITNGYSANTEAGLVIFRADSLIVLSDGFRVAYDPSAPAYNYTQGVEPSQLPPKLPNNELLPNNAYFHAYTGDRFGCTDLWGDEIDIDFTNSSTVLGSQGDGTVYTESDKGKMFEKIMGCNSNPTAQQSDPANVSMDANGVKISVRGPIISTTSPFFTSSLSTTSCNNTILQDYGWSSGGIWSYSGPFNITPRTANARKSIKYGRIEFEAKLPRTSYTYPELFMQADENNETLPLTNGKPYFNNVDYGSTWFLSSWDKADKVGDVDIYNGGTYTPGTIPTVTFNGGTGATGIAIMNTLPIATAGTKVQRVLITNQGSGYTTDPTITFSPSGASGKVNKPSTWGGGVSIVDVIKADGSDGHGSGYTPTTSDPVTVSFSGGGGSGATAIVKMTSSGDKIDHVEITNSGSGYTSPPTVTFAGGGSPTENATAFATISHRCEDEVYHIQMGPQTYPEYTHHHEFLPLSGSTANITQIPNNSDNRSFSYTFHKYVCEWLPGEMRFLIDSAEIGRTTHAVPYESVIISVINLKQLPGAIVDSHEGDDLPNNYSKGFAIGENELGENNDLIIKHIKIRPFSNTICGVTSNKKSSNDKPKSLAVNPSGISISNIIPNPAQDKISFQVSFTGENISETPLKIEIYNSLGQVISHLFDGNSSGATSSFNFSTAGIPSGSYYVRVSSGDQRASKSLIIQR